MHISSNYSPFNSNYSHFSLNYSESKSTALGVHGINVFEVCRRLEILYAILVSVVDTTLVIFENWQFWQSELTHEPISQRYNNPTTPMVVRLPFLPKKWVVCGSTTALRRIEPYHSIDGVYEPRPAVFLRQRTVFVCRKQVPLPQYQSTNQSYDASVS